MEKWDRTYFLDDSPETYPSERVVKNELNSDGTLSPVESKKDANHGFWTYANSFTFNPGRVASVDRRDMIISVRGTAVVLPHLIFDNFHTVENLLFEERSITQRR